MENVRVLQIVTSMNYAGIETLLMNLYRNIDKSKIQFDFLLHSKEESDYEKEILSLGGKIFRISKYTAFNQRKYRNELYHFFIKHPEYEIIHSHLNAFSKVVLEVAKEAGIESRIAHSHASRPKLSPKMLAKWYIKRKIDNYANYKFSCSQPAASWLYNSMENVIYFNNSIETKKFSFNEVTRHKVRDDLRIGKNTLLIGHVGNFFKEKNHKFIVKLFHQIKKENINTKLLLIGRGPKKNKIIQLVKSMKLEKDIIFIEPTDKVYTYLQAMDVFVFPSYREGLGLVTIEAQAAGLKVIAANNVPQETNITSLIKYISLDEAKKVWVDEILESEIKEKRVFVDQIIKNKGFDINDNSKWLENFYLGLV